MYCSAGLGLTLWSLTVLDSSPTPVTASCVVLGKLLSFSGPESLTFRVRYSVTYFIEL